MVSAVEPCHTPVRFHDGLLHSQFRLWSSLVQLLNLAGVHSPLVWNFLLVSHRGPNLNNDVVPPLLTPYILTLHIKRNGIRNSSYSYLDPYVNSSFRT